MNPRGNVLVVHVVAARNLYIRAQKTLDVYTSVATSGKGPWKSKVTTNTVRVEPSSNARGEPCRWDEHCEFQLNDMDTKLVVHVNHKTMLGTTETLGELCLPLEAMARFQTPVWFALSKPGTSGAGGAERGHIQLGYQFTTTSQATTSELGMPSTSVSNMSLNKIEKEKKFDRLRRKMQKFGRRGSTSSKRGSVMDDSQSLASVSIATGAMGAGSSSRRSSSLSMNSAALAFSSPTPSEQQQQNNNTHLHQQHLQQQNGDKIDSLSVHSSVTADLNVHNHQQQSHQQSQQHQFKQQKANASFSSVLFGTARSARLGAVAGAATAPAAAAVPVIAPIVANRDSSRRGSMESSSGFASLASGQLGALNENTSPEYLLSVIKHLRTELMKKEERIRDLEQYTDKLVNKVMVSNPELLQVSPKPPINSRR